jgi:hypothetical protein
LPDKRKKDSDKKIREMAIDIVNELLKSGEHMNADIGIETGDIIAKKCPGPVNYVCPTEDFRCTKFSCNVKDQFICLGKFTGARDFAFSV